MSQSRNEWHFEEFYTSSECKVTLLSYGTLIHLGHIDPTTFKKFPRGMETGEEPPAAVYVSKCEESTIYDRQQMR